MDIIEANNEILRRMHEKLATLEPGSPEFKELVREIEDFTKMQVELKKAPSEFWLKVTGIFAPILCTIGLYGASIYVDNSEYIKPKVASSMEKMVTPWKK